MGHDKLITLAASHGITLTEDDFTQPKMQELELDELDAVAGGKFTCYCDRGGQGSGPGGFCICPREGNGVGLNGDYWQRM